MLHGTRCVNTQSRWTSECLSGTGQRTLFSFFLNFTSWFFRNNSKPHFNFNLFLFRKKCYLSDWKKKTMGRYVLVIKINIKFTQTCKLLHKQELNHWFLCTLTCAEGKAVQCGGYVEFGLNVIKLDYYCVWDLLGPDHLWVNRPSVKRIRGDLPLKNIVL